MPVEFRPIEVTSSTWKMFPRHQLSEEYEDLSKPLAKRMREGVEKYGVMLRSVVLKRESGGLSVLDGWQMYQACIAADVQPEFVELVGGIEAKDFVEIMNNYRRHETAREKAKRLRGRRAELKAAVDGGASVKDAAAELGISRSTAFNDLKAAPIVRCERCERVNATGDDCPRCQLLRIDAVREPDEPADMNGTPADDEPTEGYPETPAEPEPPHRLLDANFVEVPEHVLEAFEVAAELANICHEVDQIAKKLAKILAKKVGARAISQTAAQRVKDVRQHIWQARPTHVCAYCQGRDDKCSACRGQGWQPTAAFATAPREMQDAMRAIGSKNVPI